MDVPAGGGIGDPMYTADLLNTEERSPSELLSEPSHCPTQPESPVTYTHTYNKTVKPMTEQKDHVHTHKLTSVL